jgi:hypothetical protein
MSTLLQRHQAKNGREMGVNVSSQAEGEGNHWVDLFKKIKQKPLKIAPQCRVVKSLSWKLLWENFLNSDCISLAVSAPELTALLEASHYEGEERYAAH